MALINYQAKVREFEEKFGRYFSLLPSQNRMRYLIVRAVVWFATLIRRLFSGGLWYIFGIYPPCPHCGANEWYETYKGTRCGKCDYRNDWRD